jgi:hypothetical protein
MSILSSTVTSRYYNCRIDGSSSPGNYGHPIVLQKTRTSQKEDGVKEHVSKKIGLMSERRDGSIDIDYIC